MNKYIKKIRTAAYVGLFGSIAIAVAAILFIMVSKYRFYMDNAAYQKLMMAGVILAVLDLVMVMWSIRKQIPRLRQLEDLESKFKGYSSMVVRVYSWTFAVVTAECALIVLCNNRQLIMFLLLLVLSLFLSFPNIYKIKVDLGLSDEQMVSLFGDSYVRDTPQPDAEANSDKVEDADNTESTDEKK